MVWFWQKLKTALLRRGPLLLSGEDIESIRLTRNLVRHGELIESGWRAYRSTVLQEVTDEYYLKHFRDCYFSGAYYLYHGVRRAFLDVDIYGKASQQDYDDMAMIFAELEEWRAYAEGKK